MLYLCKFVTLELKEISLRIAVYLPFISYQGIKQFSADLVGKQSNRRSSVCIFGKHNAEGELSSEASINGQ